MKIASSVVLVQDEQGTIYAIPPEFSDDWQMVQVLGIIELPAYATPIALDDTLHAIFLAHSTENAA
jgi:hypothetical protein